MDDVNAVPDFAKALTANNPAAVLREGVIISIPDTNDLIIQLEGSNETVTVQQVANLYAMAGDVVWVLIQEGLAVAIGIKYRPPSTSLGWVNEGRATADQAGIIVITFLTNLSVLFPANSGRKYLFNVSAEILGSVTGDVFVLKGISYPSATQRFRITDRIHSNAASFTISKHWTNGDDMGGDSEMKLTLERAVGTGGMTLGAATNNPALLTITDIGAL